MAGYVRWLAAYYLTMAAARREEMATLRQFLLAAGHKRTAEILSQLLLAWQHFLAYAYHSGTLTLEECVTYWHRAWQACGQVGAQQAAHHHSEDPVPRFLTLLSALFTTGNAHLEDATALGPPSQDTDQFGWQRGAAGDHGRASWQALGERIGWIDATNLYLHPEAAYRAAQRFADGQHTPLPVTQRTLWKRLREAGVLTVQGTRSQNTVNKRIGPHAQQTTVVIARQTYVQKNSNISNISNTTPEESSNGKENKTIPGWCFPGWWLAKQQQTATQRHTISNRRNGKRRVADSVADSTAMLLFSSDHLDLQSIKKQLDSFHDAVVAVSAASIHPVQTPSFDLSFPPHGF